MRTAIVVGALAMALSLASCAGAPQRDDGWSKIVAGDYTGARDWYEAVLARNPDDAYAHLNLGVALEKLGDREGAARHYRAAIAKGRRAEVAEVAEDGTVKRQRATVAQLAERNLAELGLGS